MLTGLQTEFSQAAVAGMEGVLAEGWTEPHWAKPYVMFALRVSHTAAGAVTTFRCTYNHFLVHSGVVDGMIESGR